MVWSKTSKIEKEFKYVFPKIELNTYRLNEREIELNTFIYIPFGEIRADKA